MVCWIRLNRFTFFHVRVIGSTNVPFLLFSIRYKFQHLGYGVDGGLGISHVPCDHLPKTILWKSMENPLTFTEVMMLTLQGFCIPQTSNKKAEESVSIIRKPEKCVIIIDHDFDR